MIFSSVFPGFRFSQKAEVKIIFWGNISSSLIEPVIQDFNEKNKRIEIDYQEIRGKNYEAEIVSVLAAGRGPDIFLLTQDQLLKHADKTFKVPYEIFPRREFMDMFFDGADIHLSKDGIRGFPFLADPLVLYWNQDLFKNAGLALPPKTWDEFLTSSQKLTKISEDGIIMQTGAALGLFSNINHAKDILSLLILQTGKPIVEKENLKAALDGIGTSLSFFSNFGNERSQAYSWNSSLAPSKEAFGQGRLAMYLGYASEYQEIKNKNPHLNFDVVVVPQTKESKKQLTFGKIHTFVISRLNRDKNSAFLFMRDFMNQETQTQLVEKTFLASPMRSLLAKIQKDPIKEVFNRSAILVKTWLDPDPQLTEEIFKTMIEDYASGRKDLEKIIAEAKIKLENLLNDKRPK